MVSISCLDKAAGKADVTDRSSSILHVLDLCNKSLILTSSVVVSSWKSYTNIEWLSLSFIVFIGKAAYVIAFSPALLFQKKGHFDKKSVQHMKELIPGNFFVSPACLLKPLLLWTERPHLRGKNSPYMMERHW